MYLYGIESGGLYIVKSRGIPSRGTSIAEAFSRRLEQGTDIGLPACISLVSKISSHMAITIYKKFPFASFPNSPVQCKIPQQY